VPVQLDCSGALIATFSVDAAIKFWDLTPHEAGCAPPDALPQRAKDRRRVKGKRARSVRPQSIGAPSWVRDAACPISTG
jgi:hypothetical protein